MKQRKILPYPSLTDALKKKTGYSSRPQEFYYISDYSEKKDLAVESEDAASSVFIIRDPDGFWAISEKPFWGRKRCTIRTSQFLFGKDGVVCNDAVIGLAIRWRSASSGQRGVFKIGTITKAEPSKNFDSKFEFVRGQLRGMVTLETILYIEKAGCPSADESHLANVAGTVVGELDSITIRLDGSGSVFPVCTMPMKSKALWTLKCDWTDPTSDSVADCVSLNLNTLHRKYKYIDRSQPTYNEQLFAEVMAAAMSVLIEKVRAEYGAFWDQIMQNDGLDEGSIGQLIYYFSDKLEWDISSPDKVSLSARKFFEEKLK